jgi:excisionase family DNA binding protein
MNNKFPSGYDRAERASMCSDLMTMKQAAEYLMISERTLYRMKADKTGPVWVRMSRGRIGYRKSDLDGFIASHAQKEKP